jgi:hypothetical protein
MVGQRRRNLSTYLLSYPHTHMHTCCGDGQTRDAKDLDRATGLLSLPHLLRKERYDSGELVRFGRLVHDVGSGAITPKLPQHDLGR